MHTSLELFHPHETLCVHKHENTYRKSQKQMLFSISEKGMILNMDITHAV